MLQLAFTPGTFYLRGDCTAWIHEQFSTQNFLTDLKSGQTPPGTPS